MPERTPEDAAGGWFADRVVVRFAAAGDAFADGTEGSGSDPASLPGAVTLTASSTVAGGVRDRAGNVSAEASRLVRVDAAAPAVALTCPASAEVGADARGSWSAHDGESGLDTPAEGSVALDTSTTGTHTSEVDARDRVGHRSTASCTYTVATPAPGEQEQQESPPPPPETETEPAPTPAPEPQPTPTPEPEPTATPTPEPEPASAAEPAPAPAPSPVPADAVAPAPFAPAPLVPTTSLSRQPAPTLRVRTTRVRARRGALRLTVACRRSAPATCRQRLALLHGRHTVARTGRLRIAPGATSRTALRLSAAARAQLRRRGRLRVTVAVDGRRSAAVVVLAR